MPLKGITDVMRNFFTENSAYRIAPEAILELQHLQQYAEKKAQEMLRDKQYTIIQPDKSDHNFYRGPYMFLGNTYDLLFKIFVNDGSWFLLDNTGDEIAILFSNDFRQGSDGVLYECKKHSFKISKKIKDNVSTLKIYLRGECHGQGIYYNRRSKKSSESLRKISEQMENKLQKLFS